MISRLGQKLRHLRVRAQLSQAELAPHIGLRESSKGYVSEIESGKKVPPAETVLRIAQYFNVTTDYLLRDDIPEQDWK